MTDTPKKRGRKKLPRVEVAAVLLSLKYDPIVQLVQQASDPDCDPKIRAAINRDLLTYIAARKRPDETPEEKERHDAVTELFKAIASQGRPQPPAQEPQETEDDEEDAK